MYKITAIYDNGGKTAYRYTVVLNEYVVVNGHRVYTALFLSDNPDCGQDIAQVYSSNCGEQHPGKEITLDDLPEDVQKHVIERLMQIKQGCLRPAWREYFIEIAKVVSSRSTCLRRRYGAVIVKDNVIVSTGYNGSPRGSVNCVDRGICRRKELNIPSGQRYELCEAVHAEQNAVINGSPERMKDATIYIAGFEEDNTFAEGRPCLLCGRVIRNAQIKEVVYLSKDGSIVVGEDSYLKI